MTNKDHEIYMAVKNLLRKYSRDFSVSSAMGAIDRIMQSEDADKFTICLQKWLAHLPSASLPLPPKRAVRKSMEKKRAKRR